MTDAGKQIGQSLVVARWLGLTEEVLSASKFNSARN